MAKELTPEKLEEVWTTIENQLGSFSGQRYDSMGEQDGYRIVLLNGAFEQADVGFSSHL